MKILYLIDTLEGYGAEKSIAQIALRLKEITPVFVHIYEGNKLKQFIQSAGVNVYSLNIKDKFGYEEAVERLVQVVKKEKPIIIHSTLYRADMVARRLKKRIPNIILVGSIVSNSYGKNRYSQLSLLSKIKLLSAQFKDRKTAKEVDHFIFNSEAIREDNVRALEIPLYKVKVIPRGRSFDEYSINCGSRDDLKQEFGLENKKVFLTVGRLSKGKGHFDLIQAFKLFVQGKENVVLLIAGEGPMRNQLNQLIDKLNLTEKVILLGYREDIPKLLFLADYFVFSTYYEGLPGALIEAVISRTPAIVSSIKENQECISEKAALFFEPGDIEGLKLKLEESLVRNDWEKRVNEAHEKAREKFSLDLISDKYENFYKEIIKKHFAKQKTG